MTYSFPCQDLSQQGKQKGLNKNTRSGLLYEIERILKENKNNLPKVLLLENVKALATKKFIDQFNEWIEVLSDLGYNSNWKIINSSDFGSPQNRERVFMVSILGDKKFEFSKINNLKLKIVNDIWQHNVQHITFKLTKDQFLSNFNETKNQIKKAFINNYTKFNSENYLYDLNAKGPTLTASGANSRLKFLVNDEIKIMNSLESFLYMGFDVEDYEKVKKTNLVSDNKIIFTAGNSISVEVLSNIFEKLIKDKII
ncbi:DNA (cytosine-5-)-methyltransferase [Mycoplasmopsis cynos]|uniref:DNA (cytosine-5-)-methyltransferase n=1 Tax=Mycoplasmopsis cynos TaxID=171284 RepID=A0ABD8AKV9_9BACT|nr:DNA (cytosine-5-)-methyltransferase [Mycoplasmopsis cynos]UWV81021.1 DNA cytosine methyltransferase [Mycoplasmopsis cynos]WAM06062.1 DNA cytosine methyltransferase [Mycoplasmopsis cynos]WAM09158.1 DNA cytosine methyltransferase [Mycoplasmopsis cynos]WQQ20322.1 DNA (cytosine-5-)-methyltransferase [Mycoplasmopsis cynos]